MKKFKSVIALLLVFLLAISATATGTDTKIVIVKYFVSENAVYQYDEVTITVWLKSEDTLSEDGITPVTGAFNGTSVKCVKEDKGY